MSGPAAAAGLAIGDQQQRDPSFGCGEETCFPLGRTDLVEMVGYKGCSHIALSRVIK